MLIVELSGYFLNRFLGNRTGFVAWYGARYLTPCGFGGLGGGGLPPPNMDGMIPNSSEAD